MYFEKGRPRSQIRALRPLSMYRAQWFDPRSGTWLDAGSGWVQSNTSGVVSPLPEFPTDNDWGLRLILCGSGAVLDPVGLALHSWPWAQREFRPA